MDNTRLLQFGPFPLRIMIGITFLAHRVPSLADFGQVQGFVGRMGLPPEVAFVVAALEIGGAIAMFAGVLTRITAALYIVLMLATTIVVKSSRGFVGGFEVDLLLLVMAVSLHHRPWKDIYRVGRAKEGDLAEGQVARAAKGQCPFKMTTPGMSSPAR